MGNEPLENGSQVTLHVLRGRSTRRSRPMSGSTLLIGSDRLCDVQMRSADVAGKHCLISRRERDVRVCALEADHPVLVNGAVVGEAPLAHGDTLTIGPFQLSVSIAAAGHPISEQAAEASRPGAAEMRAPLKVEAHPASPPVVANQAEREPADDVGEASATEGSQATGADQDRSEPDAEFDRRKRSFNARRERFRRVRRRLFERLRERQAALARREADLEERAAQQPDVERREAELQRQSQDAERLDREMAELDRRGKAIAEEQRRLDYAIDALQAARDELASREARVGEQSAEAAQLSAILAEKQRRLDEREQAIQSATQSLDESRRTLDAQLAHADRQAEALAEQEVVFRRRAHQLDERQKAIEERETAWAAEVERTRGELENRLAELDRKQSSLDRDAILRRRQAHKLREVGLKIAQRRKHFELVTRRAGRTTPHRPPVAARHTNSPAQKHQRAERAEPPPAVSPSTEVNASDEALIDRLAAAGLSDRETLLGAHEAAARQRRTLRDELVSAGLFTDYQLDAVTEGRDEGLHFGPALLLDVIHRGAVTTTYLARAPQHAEPIAVRVLASRWRVDEHMRASLEGSVAPFLTFRHEHVAATLQLLIVDDRFGLAVEYVDGLSLADLSGDAIPPAAMVDLCRQALSALAATHRAGLAHRNLRPSRLMVDRLGALKVLGYGEPDWLSKVHRCERRRTSTPYLAPEQRSGDVPADARVDVYALGTIFKDLADVAQRTDPDGYESGGLAERFLPLLGRMTAEAFCERPSAGEALGELERITQARLGSGPAWPEAPAVIDRRRSQPNRAA